MTIRDEHLKRKPCFRSERRRAILVCTLLGITLPAQADSLSQQVKRYLQQEVRDYARTVGSKDIQIKLKPMTSDAHCDHPVTMRLSNPEQPLGRVTVSLECQQPHYWKARAYADVDVYLKLITTRRPLRRDEVVTRQALTLSRTSLRNHRQGYFTRFNQVVGKHSRRKIQPGTVITPRMIEAAELIARNDVITIIAKRQGFKASMKGVALESGHKGDKIWVRNLSSGKKIMASVESSHTVATQF
ncbi:flagellar basal body P-ring formation chaperone FlgA [Photobacterium nomapromontoriensis]|uniref:flagellar basal body P-ring formation chaperone FlgA n=1 Tax=Photobacterium nomapromontoriensis TaxID=2910237 RepID=UPI003D148E8D